MQQNKNLLKTAIISGLILLPFTLLAQELATQTGQIATGTDVLSFLPESTKLTVVTLGMGGFTGWAVGYTMKKFAKLAALFVGISFISLQFLAFNRFITVDWDKIKSVVPNEQIQRSWLNAMSVLTFNLPFVGSFLAGFWMGFRKG